MKKISLAGILIGAMFLVSGAQARDFAGELDIGTTGLGAHLVSPITPTVNGRIGFNAFNYTYSSSTANANYDFKLKAQTIDLLADWYPSANGFHVTGGLIFNGNKIDMRGKPNNAGNFTFQGNTYASAQAGSVVGRADFRSTAPYLGIGFGNPMTNAAGGWGFTSDLGAMFQGSPNTTLRSEGCTASAATCAQLASDLVLENARLRDKVKNANVYPVLRIGASYRF